MARNQYMRDDKRDPIECSLFYLALKKKAVLVGLWKLASGHSDQQTMLKFLANNFEEERWKTAAMKNAFALLGKQRYGMDIRYVHRLTDVEYAAAFFLLADRLADAVGVCIKNLNDVPLAIIITRVYEGRLCKARKLICEGDDSSVLKSIIQEHMIEPALQARDRWLLNIGYTLSKQRDNALLSTLVFFRFMRLLQKDAI